MIERYKRNLPQRRGRARRRGGDVEDLEVKYQTGMQAIDEPSIRSCSYFSLPSIFSISSAAKFLYAVLSLT
jgi:hypothetical protein